MSSRILSAAVGVWLLAGAAAARQHEHGTTATEKLGVVNFQTSCSADAQPLFNRAVALLHSFEFGPAIAGFTAVLKTDPSCGMADWGIALSRWGNPFAIAIRPPAQLQQGLDAVTQAALAGMKTPREHAYVNAVAQLYNDVDTVDQRTRVVAYRDAMAALSASNPDDTEAAIFHALAIAAAASPTDKTYADQLQAGAILEALIEKQPDHPGLAHYIIHAYDVPPLADKALAAARRYSQIAPSAPHALHMPSHTFTRLGLWQDSIDANIASGNEARRVGATAEELHALDYRTYAYLQSGQDAAAHAALVSLPEVRARLDPGAVTSAAPPLAGGFALAAIPARYALERGAWAEAAALTLQPSGYPFADSLTVFAVALGAARTGDTAAARAGVTSLAAIRDRLAEKKETYWAGESEIQRLSVTAWLALAEGHAEEALAGMREAAAAEDATEKSAVTPGPLAPARELLGEMLLELKRPADALEEFEATLRKEPNRFRTMFGAAKAASLAGDRQKAHDYAAMLVKVCERGDTPGRPELVQARQWAAGVQ